MHARDVDCRCGEINLRGYLAFDGSVAGKRPGVLVFHEGLGLGQFAMECARRLDDAHRAVQRAGRPSRLGGDERPVR
jgi:dienelactone hydrolase